MLYLVVVYMYYYDMTTYYLSMNGKETLSLIVK